MLLRESYWEGKVGSTRRGEVIAKEGAVSAHGGLRSRGSRGGRRSGSGRSGWSHRGRGRSLLCLEGRGRDAGRGRCWLRTTTGAEAGRGRAATAKRWLPALQRLQFARILTAVALDADGALVAGAAPGAGAALHRQGRAGQGGASGMVRVERERPNAMHRRAGRSQEPPEQRAPAYVGAVGGQLGAGGAAAGAVQVAVGAAGAELVVLAALGAKAAGGARGAALAVAADNGERSGNESGHVLLCTPPLLIPQQLPPLP